MTIKNAVAVAAAVACILAFAWFGSSPVKASPVPDAAFLAKAEELAEWIDDNSDYGPLPWHPAYIFLPTETLHYMAFQAASGGYNGQSEIIAAAYSQGVMYLPDGFDIDADASTLLHELVHHHQYVTDKEFECVGKAEKEAYGLEGQYREERGLSPGIDPITLLVATTCREAWQ